VGDRHLYGVETTYLTRSSKRAPQPRRGWSGGAELRWSEGRPEGGSRCGISPWWAVSLAQSSQWKCHIMAFTMVDSRRASYIESRSPRPFVAPKPMAGKKWLDHPSSAACCLNLSHTCSSDFRRLPAAWSPPAPAAPSRPTWQSGSRRPPACRRPSPTSLTHRARRRRDEAVARG